MGTGKGRQIFLLFLSLCVGNKVTGAHTFVMNGQYPLHPPFPSTNLCNILCKKIVLGIIYTLYALTLCLDVCTNALDLILIICYKSKSLHLQSIFILAQFGHLVNLSTAPPPSMGQYDSFPNGPLLSLVGALIFEH